MRRRWRGGAGQSMRGRWGGRFALSLPFREPRMSVSSCFPRIPYGSRKKRRRRGIHAGPSPSLPVILFLVLGFFGAFGCFLDQTFGGIQAQGGGARRRERYTTTQDEQAQHGQVLRRTRRVGGWKRRTESWRSGAMTFGGGMLRKRGGGGGAVRIRR